MVMYDQGIVWAQSLIHPLEKECTTALQKNILLVSLSQDLGNLKLQIENSAEMKLNKFLVTECTYPKLYRLYSKVLETVGALLTADTTLNQKYPLFVVQDYGIKSEVFGSDEKGYYIQVSSGAIESLTDSELCGLLGQSVAHIRTGHIQFIELLRLMKTATMRIPVVGNIVGHEIWSKFAHWQVFSDYTADRIGAICAGSVTDMMSVIAKQVGCNSNPYTLITGTEDISSLPMSGIFFVWMMQQMPTCNALGRIKELSEWSKNTDFRNKYPYMFYCAKIDRNDTPKDDIEEKVMRLHSEARNGDGNSAAILGECYLKGLNKLPESLPLGLSMIRYAAQHGNGGAMYILYSASAVGIPGTNFNSQLRRQLLLAAKSRNKQITDTVEPKIKLSNPELIIKKLYNSDSKFSVNETLIGFPIDFQGINLLADRFLLELSEPILAYECFRFEGEYYGTVLTSLGIYCLTEGKKYPQIFDWKELKKENMYSVKDGQYEYLRSGNRNIYQFRNGSDNIKGTMGELIVTIKTMLKTIIL